MMVDAKPDVLLLDLHLAQKWSTTPGLIKAQLACAKQVLAVSFANDDESRALAESYGVAVLLDKMNLYNELVPAIRRCLKVATIPKPQRL